MLSPLELLMHSCSSCCFHSLGCSCSCSVSLGIIITGHPARFEFRELFFHVNLNDVWAATWPQLEKFYIWPTRVCVWYRHVHVSMLLCSIVCLTDNSFWSWLWPKAKHPATQYHQFPHCFFEQDTVDGAREHWGKVDPAPPKCSISHDSYDPKWEEEFTWLRYMYMYVPADQDDGLSILCTLCHKHNKLSKWMGWLTTV